MKASRKKNQKNIKLLVVAAVVILPALTFFIGFKLHPQQPVISNVCIPSHHKNTDSFLSPVMN